MKYSVYRTYILSRDSVISFLSIIGTPPNVLIHYNTTTTIVNFET